MEAALLYLLKANAVLVLFATAYYGLLRKLTFFHLNRAYLLLALLFAAAYPVLPVPALLPAVVAQAMPAAAPAAPATGAVAAADAATAPACNWLPWLLGTYAAGAALLLLRLLAQLLSLALVRRRARPARVLGEPVRVLAGRGGPFSFGQTIYLSEGTLANATDLAAALRHEQAHVGQHHTLDVLVMQLATALAWLNPAAWLLRRAALDNLEYLADRAALQTGLDRRLYQYSLLHQQPSGVPAPALAFHLDFNALKNRIAMLNQPVSTTRQLGRYLLAAPLAMLLALGYSAARAQTAPPAASHYLPATSAYFIDGAPAPVAAADALEAAEAATPGLIARADVLSGTEARIFLNGQSDLTGVVAITTKANQASSAVRSLDARITQVVALVPRIEASELPAAAQRYLASNFADYRLAVVNKILPAARQQAVYQVNIAKGRRPYGYLLFAADGGFLERI